MNKDYEQTVREQFPNLQYGEFKILDNREERLGIDDLSYQNSCLRPQFREIIELFVMACKGFVNFYSAEGLAISLNNQLEELLYRLEPEKTVLVFPGQGSQPVKDLLPKEVVNYFQFVNLLTKRRLSKEMRVEGVDIINGRSVLRKTLPSKLTTCILMDDVVLSGSTAQAVRSFIDDRGEYDWYTASWMSLSPLQARDRKKDDCFKSGLPGFRRTLTSVVYQGLSGTPANNSLSSFAEVNEKSEAIIDGYKRKYVEDFTTFDEAIESLRRLKNG